MLNVNINVGTVNVASAADNIQKTSEKKLFVVEEGTLVIDPEALTGKQKHILKQLLASEMLDQSGAILDETTQATINASLEALPKMEDTAQKLIGIIPPKDIPLMYASLYLRTRHKLGEPVEGIKAQIVKVYGTRGAHFANLCTAGYLEEWFIPVYQEWLRQSGDASIAKARFRKFYNNIVDDLPWTVFVRGVMPEAKLIATIERKMRNNAEIGVRYLNLHALGKSNVKKVVRALPKITEAAHAIIAVQEREKERIFVRLERIDLSQLA